MHAHAEVCNHVCVSKDAHGHSESFAIVVSKHVHTCTLTLESKYACMRAHSLASMCSLTD